MVIVAVDDGSL